jgi:flavorubredoxin
MLPEMRIFLRKLDQFEFQGKVGGAFGSYEWNDEVPQRIYEIMGNIMKMDMVGEALKIQPPMLGHKEAEAREYGQRIALKIKEIKKT